MIPLEADRWLFELHRTAGQALLPLARLALVGAVPALAALVLRLARRRAPATEAPRDSR